VHLSHAAMKYAFRRVIDIFSLPSHHICIAFIYVQPVTHWLDANNTCMHITKSTIFCRSLLIHAAPWFMHFMLYPFYFLTNWRLRCSSIQCVLLKIRKCKYRPSRWIAEKIHSNNDLQCMSVFYLFLYFSLYGYL